MSDSGPSSVDEYISQCPLQVQDLLRELRAVIQQTAPDATEKISYQMPTFYLRGNLVHFAAFKNHIGFYPAASGVEAFKDVLTGYKISRGTIQFPLDQPLPYDLIRSIVQFRVAENLARAKKT